jgi:hypothetical protein
MKFQSVLLQVAGLMYRYNVLYMRRWFLVPRWLAKLSSMSVGWLLRSGAPQEGAIGATLEIQRAQQLEILEQQVLLSRARDVRRQVDVTLVLYLYCCVLTYITPAF